MSLCAAARRDLRKKTGDNSIELMVLQERIELSTSPLPRECSMLCTGLRRVADTADRVDNQRYSVCYRFILIAVVCAVVVAIWSLARMSYQRDKP